MMDEMLFLESRSSQAKFQKLYRDLKSQDEMELATATRSLSIELSMVQSIETISFNIEQFIPVLLDLLKVSSIPEIPESSIISLNYILDIYPHAIRKFADQRTINTIFSVFQSDQLFESIDPCVSLLKRVSEEFGNAVLSCPLFKMMFNFQDFCTVATHVTLPLGFQRASQSFVCLKEKFVRFWVYLIEIFSA